ncbi:MAG TPA: DinB family protein [Candidatus Acidoferrales bacterium]|nr:DinB family protein [Candidatus Acidoferrales bacterium]
MNPYASHLESRDPFAVIAETPQQLAQMVRAADQAALDRSPAPGKWSVREILTHLADTEVVFAFRLRQSVAEAHHTVQPFDQDRWAAHYESYDAFTALETFTAVRRWNILFLSALPPEVFAKTMTHPERGTMTLQVVVETMGGHDRNHAKQIAGILGKAATA